MVTGHNQVLCKWEFNCDAAPHVQSIPSASGNLLSRQLRAAVIAGVGCGRVCERGGGVLLSASFSLSLLYQQGPPQVLDSSAVAPTADCGYQLSTAINRNQELCGRKPAVSPSRGSPGSPIRSPAVHLGQCCLQRLSVSSPHVSGLA